MEEPSTRNMVYKLASPAMYRHNELNLSRLEQPNAAKELKELKRRMGDTQKS